MQSYCFKGLSGMLVFESGVSTGIEVLSEWLGERAEKAIRLKSHTLRGIPKQKSILRWTAQDRNGRGSAALPSLQVAAPHPVANGVSFPRCHQSPSAVPLTDTTTDCYN